jgi:hypothetical protein
MEDLDARLRLFDEAEVDEIQIPPTGRTFSEEEIIDILRQQIAYLLDHKRDWLLGKLYRLDIREQDIKIALNLPNEPPSQALARLVVARQQERSSTKRSVDVEPLDPDGEFGDLIW